MFCLNIDFKKWFKEYKFLEFNLFLIICYVFIMINGLGKKKKFGF